MTNEAEPSFQRKLESRESWQDCYQEIVMHPSKAFVLSSDQQKSTTAPRTAMTFDEVLNQVRELLQSKGRWLTVR